MRSALVVVDVQESFRQPASWETVSDPDVADKVDRLVRAARDRGDLVVWVLHAEPGTGNVFDPARGYVRLIEGLVDPADDEPVLVKTVHNAFTTTDLQARLDDQGIRHVVVCGIRTEQCCETTARLASDLGYDVTFVVDATATMPIEHPDAPVGRPVAEILADPRTLSTDAVIERTVYALAGRFATVRTVEEMTAAVAAG
jgi:nicotinamidase-related amidase